MPIREIVDRSLGVGEPLKCERSLLYCADVDRDPVGMFGKPQVGQTGGPRRSGLCDPFGEVD